MDAIWTLGTWTVKPGSEDAFVAAWSKLAREAAERFDAERPTLLRDRERPNVFVTAGPWPSLEVIAEFRSSDLFQAALAEIRPLLESFQPLTLDEVAWS